MMFLMIIIWLLVVWWVIVGFVGKIFVDLKHTKRTGFVIAPFIFVNWDKIDKFKSIEVEEKVLRKFERYWLQQAILTPVVMVVLYCLCFVVLYLYYLLIKGLSFKWAFKRAKFYNPFEIDARLHMGG